MHAPSPSNLPPAPPGRTGWPWTEESPQLPDAMPDGSPWPRVSIVTPSFNQGQFLEETIRSVLLQGYPNLEYIIIDGESTDESVAVIRAYEPWLAYWVSESDSGQSEAINKGLARTTGPILSWLNSDDRFKPGAIESGVKALAAQPHVGVIYGDFDEIDEMGNRLRTCRAREFDIRRQMVAQMIPQPAALFRRAVWEKVGPLRTDLHYAMDRDFWNRAALSFPIMHVPAPIAEMRMHASSKTVSQTVLFAYELERLYKEFFAAADVPAELKALEREARGANFFGMGREHLRAREYREARRAFANAWRIYPLNLNKPMILPFWLDSILKTNFSSTLFQLAIWVKHGTWESGER